MRVRRPGRVIVIGGGPAGLMAAGKAAAAGASVLLLERMDRVGLKLGLTGKGRCNLTNVAPVPEMLQHFGAGGNFLRAALCNFGNRRLIGFFADLGVATAVERGGRVFP
ncbi:MAG TPA: NAD(P)/FAD-dependent oxidoreductase, partial [bacterium]|nr:NAD(P)/FAD-dependent oxidoreductase [bacterium]